jgi:recombination protein RecR
MESLLHKLIQTFSRLPGFGPRLAQKTVLHLLKNRDTLVVRLIEDLLNVKNNLLRCSLCGNWDQTDPCSFCTDPQRDASLLCIVENLSDLWAFERARFFLGRYHILGGVLSAVDGISPDQLALNTLAQRLQNGTISEVILALSSTLEGQATLFYLVDFLKPFSVKISSLAQGVPMGGEVNYLDEATLSAAFLDRRILASVEEFGEQKKAS